VGRVVVPACWQFLKLVRDLTVLFRLHPYVAPVEHNSSESRELEVVLDRPRVVPLSPFVEIPRSGSLAALLYPPKRLWYIP